MPYAKKTKVKSKKEWRRVIREKMETKNYLR